MDKNKAIERIKKCFALSKSANSNEAAAALRQAQKLMDMFDLEEGDIEKSAWGNKTVECPIQVNKKPPLALMALVNLVKKAFSVRPIFDKTLRVSDYSYTIRYFGPVTRIEMATYAHVVIFRAMEAGWKEYLAANPHMRGNKGGRQGFHLGFLSAIEAKVEAIGFTDDEQKRVDEMVTSFYGVLKTFKKNQSSVDGRTLNAGRDAAASFSINRPMGANRLALGSG